MKINTTFVIISEHMHLIRIALCNFLLLFFIDSFSQSIPVEKSTHTVELSGKKYYLHKVLPEQTLYSISKAYDVSVGEILKVNFKKTPALSINEILRIPYEKNGIATKDTITKVETSSYRFHIVQPKETIYSISKKYDVPISAILELNEKTNNQLFIGEHLKIPISENTENPNNEIVTSIPNDIEKESEKEVKQFKSGRKTFEVEIPQNYYDKKYFYHYVRKGETRHLIAEKYGLKVRKLVRFNKWLKQTDIMEGDKVRIPRKYARLAIIELEMKRKEKEIEDRIKQTEDIKEDSLELAELDIIIDTTPIIPPQIFKKRYSVALLLPIAKSETVLKFYQGILIGLEEFSKQSTIGVDLYTYDIENDLEKIDNTLSELLIKDIDVIIGPFNQEFFNQIALFGKINNIPVISLSAMYKNLASNSKVIQLNTSYKTLASLIAKHVTEKHMNDNLIVSYSDSSVYFSRNEYKKMAVEDKKIAIRETFINLLDNETFDYKKDHLQSFKDNLSIDSPNIVIIPCVKSSNVTHILSSLYAAKGLTDMKIIVYGMPVWQFFDDIDPTFFYNLNIHYFSPFHVNYENKDVVDFINKFRKKFMEEPHQISLRGFDSIWFILAGLEKFGNHFMYNLNYKSPVLLNSNFVFRKHENGGFENIQVYKVVYNPNYTVNSTLLQID